MRKLLVLITLLHLLQLNAQKPAYNMNIGLMANLNTSQMNVGGGHGATVTTGTQWSAGFGLYGKSAELNMFRLEAQLAFESTGSDKQMYYHPLPDESVRIYDRYYTIPLSLLLVRNLGWQEKWSLGFGFKSSFVVGHTVRHPGAPADGPATPAIIFSPDVKRWFGSPVFQFGYNFPYADVTLSGWYAVSPLIDQYGVKAVPYGISFAVKARLFTFE